MPILIVHLGDIHFRSNDNPVAARTAKMKDAFLGRFPQAGPCVIVLSGDIANTGTPEEYEAAKSFLDELRTLLLSARVPEVEFVAVPGNHDCNLNRETDTRHFIFDGLQNYLNRPLDFNGANFRAITDVQTDFFKFEAALRGQDVLPRTKWLYYQRSFTFSSGTILFHCFNTAWLSRRHEIQSELFIPTQVLSSSTPEAVDLSVAVFHHPDNWLNAVNARAVEEYTINNADVVLTGHEHAASASRRHFLEGQVIDSLEAPALQGDITEKSEFQVLSLDINSAQQQIVRFSWNGSRYTEMIAREWKLARNSGRPSYALRNSESFLDELTGVGTGFRHPRCSPPACQLKLRDIFVYPDLRRRDFETVLTARGRNALFAGPVVR